jgi:hypothetical protein
MFEKMKTQVVVGNLAVNLCSRLLVLHLSTSKRALQYFEALSHIYIDREIIARAHLLHFEFVSDGMLAPSL